MELEFQVPRSTGRGYVPCSGKGIKWLVSAFALRA